MYKEDRNYFNLLQTPSDNMSLEAVAFITMNEMLYGVAELKIKYLGVDHCL